MIELVYPIDPAPVYGPQKSASEMLPLVQPNGMVTGQAARDYCHSCPDKPMHPVVHMFVMDRNSRFFLQLRGPQKTPYPLRWDISVGGHVGYGELFEEALYRESAEELALYDFNPQYIDNYVYTSDHQKELVNVYLAIGAFDPKPDNYEVKEGRWWTIEEIRAALGGDVFTPVFEQEFKAYAKRFLTYL